MLILAAVAAAVPAAWYLAGKLHRFAYWIGRKTDAEVAALATDGWRVERLEVEPGVTLVGLGRPPVSAGAPWILFVPGNSQSILGGFRAELDALRQDRDLGWLFHAYRGFDASGGTPSPAALAADLRAQWRYLRGLGVPASRIEIWGYSLGAVLAAGLAADVADAGEQPARLVLLAAGERIPVMRAGLFGRFLPDDVYDATPALPRVTCPVVIVHGTADEALPIEGARAVHAALGTRSTLHELPGKGHFDVWQPARELLFTAPR